MYVEHERLNLINNEDIIQYQNEKEDKKIFFSICLHNEKFKEYQKNLFNDFYTKILDLIDKNSIFLDFKKDIESEIKQFNTKLKVFQEKVNIEDKIDIRWTIQIIWQETYISTLIWESSIIIFRDNKLESIIVNEVEEEDKIDIFWEIIEWELENKDKIISICSNIYNYMNDNEIKELINTNNIATNLEDILSTRVENKEIWAIEELNISIQKIKVESKKEFNLSKYNSILKKHKYSIGVIIALSIIFFIIFAIFSYLGTNKKQVIKVWWKQVEADIYQLKKKVATFISLNFNKSNSISNKKTEYEKIMQELNAFEKSNIQTLEIKKLKEQVENNYYKGFNINRVFKNNGSLENIHNFSEKELTELSWTNQIFRSLRKINISWKKWVLLWLIDNKYKWTIQKIKIPTNIKTCSNNLAGNWLYCVMDNGDIYNISKYWIQTLKNSSWTWPKKIVSIGIYGSNKIYILTNDSDLNKKGIYIIKYILKSKNNFSTPINYVFAKGTDKNLTNSITTGSNMVIDGTFLISSKKWLLQAYRKGQLSNELSLRVIPWWEKAIIDDKKDFSWKLKVIANMGSKYIHLFDFATNSLVTYLTSPYKTNSANRTSYSLIYKYKTNFVFDNENIKDVIVNYNNTTRLKTVYILTNKWVYSIQLK